MINVSDSGSLIVKYLTHIKNIIIHDQNFTTDTQNFKDTDLLEVTIKRFQKSRSNKMNRYMWGEIIPKVAFGLRQLGNRLNPNEIESTVIEVLKSTNEEAAHEYLKNRFAQQETVDEETGEIIKIKPSTRTMTNQQMLNYFEPIIQWAAEKLQVKINYPHEEENIPLEEWLKLTQND